MVAAGRFIEFQNPLPPCCSPYLVPRNSHDFYFYFQLPFRVIVFFTKNKWTVVYAWHLLLMLSTFSPFCNPCLPLRARWKQSINQFFKDRRVDTLCTTMHQAIWPLNLDLQGPRNYSFTLIKVTLFRNRTLPYCSARETNQHSLRPHSFSTSLC